MKLIGLKNVSEQTLIVNGLVNLGSVYRTYLPCGAFSADATSVSLTGKGIYHLTAVITFTAPAVGDVTFQLLENGEAVPGALATETITTATTEIKTTTLDYYFLVDSTCVLNTPSVTIKNITIQNTGVASTVSNVVLNITKEV